MSDMTLPSGVWACKHCGEPVVIRQIRGGRRWPFNRALVAAEDLPENLRYVPQHAGWGIIMVPASDMNPYRLKDVRWYAERHTCAQWLMSHRRERNDDVESLGDALAAALGFGPAS